MRTTTAIKGTNGSGNPAKFNGVYEDIFHDCIKKTEVMWPEEDGALFGRPARPIS